MKELNCPYCQAKNDVPEDSHEEDTLFQCECEECEKTFGFTVSIVRYFHEVEMPCGNGEPHKYKLTHTAPRAFSMMKCEYCDDEREPTENERRSHNLQSKAEYFASLKAEF